MVQMMFPGSAVEQSVPYRNESHPVAPDVSQHLARITKKMGKKFTIFVCSRKPCEVQKWQAQVYYQRPDLGCSVQDTDMQWRTLTQEIRTKMQY